MIFGLPSSIAVAAGLAIVVSLLTLAVGVAHWRRAPAAGVKPFGAGLEALCCVWNLAVIIAAYGKALSDGVASTGPSFVKIALGAEVLLESLASLVPLTLALPSLAAIAVAVCWSGRLRVMQSPPRIAWLALAVGLFIVGGVAPFATGLRSYLASAKHQGSWRQRVAAAESARPEFLRTSLVASLAMLAAALAVFGSRRARPQAQGSWVFTLVPTVLFGGGAAMLTWHARPLVNENRRPVSMDLSFVNTSLAIAPRIGARGVGPDALVEGPWILFEGGTIQIDGQVLKNDDALGKVLREKRALWQDVHRGARFPGNVLIDASPELSTTILAERLARIRASGYPNARFVLSEVREDERPILGKLTGVSRSAVAVTLATSKAGCGTGPVEALRLAWTRWRNEKELVDAFITQRRAGKRPCIVTIESQCDDCSLEVKESAPGKVDAFVARGAGFELDLVVFPDNVAIEVHGRTATIAELQRKLGTRLHLAVSTTAALQPWSLTRKSIDPFLMIGLQSGPALLEEARMVPTVILDKRKMRIGVGVDGDRGLVVFGISRSPIMRAELATSFLAAGCKEAVELATGDASVYLPALRRESRTDSRGPFIAVVEPAR